jgi:hypothetical protein
MNKPMDKNMTTGAKLTAIRNEMDKLKKLKYDVSNIWLSNDNESDAPEHVEQGIIDVMVSIAALQTTLKEQYNLTVEGV